MINDLWYKNAVIYCLSVGTFMDANRDGIGDFQRLTRRLDYLHGLGITTIWLMPFQPRPVADTGNVGFSAQILRRVGKTLTPSGSSVVRTSPYFLEKSVLTIL